MKPQSNSMFGFEKAKSSLEFDKIIEEISDKCVSQTGKARLRNSAPLFDIKRLRDILHQIQEMRDIFLSEGGLPIWEFSDIRSLLNKIEPIDSYLEVHDCLKVQNIAEVTADIDKFFNKTEDKYPNLINFVEQLSPNDQLLKQLKFTFEPSGNIYDNASNELRAIRKDINRLNDEIHIRMKRILKKNSDFLQEDYITLRDGRLVLPVREFSVSKIPGIVHGQSGSGSTYFVEPMTIVDLNNQMQKLIASEKREIVKILRRIAAQIKEDEPALLINFDILNELDTLQAKAKYANEVDAAQPYINEEYYWDLRSAKHPLLLKKDVDSVVPLDLKIGQEYRELIISGPNAGGKTVALKTVGILQLMAQSGFHVPVQEGSIFPICKQIFTVIGDEQSIEHDLSTFSSHIQAIEHIFRNLDDMALVLIDEIGTGTEPSGGAALAIAIMNALNKDGMVSIISTHHNQLKAYASQTAGIENAAMQFDHDHLTPLFTMEMGIPGSSYTFEICKRLGLSDNIVEEAVKISGEDSFKLDRLLIDIGKKSQEYHDKTRDASIRESELNSLMQLYQDRNDAIKKQRKKLEKEAAKSAHTVLEDTNRQIESLVREIRESNADKKVVKNARLILEKKKAEVAAMIAEDKKPASEMTTDQLKKGMKVKSLSFDIKGTISKIFPGKKQVMLEKDGMSVTVDIADIELLEPGVAKPGRKKKTTVKPEPGGVNISYELDLRGMQVDEALESVEAYLDKAIISSWDEVRLIHGKGTGALREAIHRYLSAQKSISSFRLGKWGEGDSGVTVVNLK